MSVIFKTKLKSAKTAVAEKNYEYAYDLCHDLLELDESNYNVHILLGVSCQHTGNWTEGERTYRTAMAMPKANIMAWQGLCALFEASKDRVKYELALADLRDQYIREENRDKAWETMHKMIGLCEEDTTESSKRKLVRILGELTTGGKFHELLSATGGADPKPPTEIELLERMYDIENTLDQRVIDREIEKRRTRLNAGPIAQVRREVKTEVWGQSSALQTLEKLVEYYKNSSDGGNNSSSILLYEELLFTTLNERVVVVGNNDPGKRSEMKAMATQIHTLAEHLISHGRCSSAFEYLIEVADTVDLGPVIDGYLQHFPHSRLNKSAIAWKEIADNQNCGSGLDTARDGCADAPSSPFAHLQLVQAALSCQEYRLAVDTGIRARKALQEFASNFSIQLRRTRLSIDMAMADSYLKIGPETATNAEELYRKCMEAELDEKDHRRAVLGLGLALCALGEYNECRQLLNAAVEQDHNNDLALGTLGYVRLQENDSQEAVEYLKQAIALNPNYASHHANLGNAYWAMGSEWQSDKQYAYASWIAAARIDAHISETFSGLGKWYQQYGEDKQRAQKCFVKAVDLDQTNGEAGRALAEIYLGEGRDDLCEDLLLRVTEARRDQQWAWKTLGFLLLRQNNYEQAVVGFRNALGLDREDVLCWEGLCESYMGIGRIGTAVKVAEKVAELDDSRVAGHWLSAHACMMANDLDSSIKHFDTALACCQKTTDMEGIWRQPLVVGKAECLMACAEQRYTDRLLGRVADASNQALDSLLSFMTSHTNTTPTYLMWSIVSAACSWIMEVRSMLEGRPGLLRQDTVRQLTAIAQSAEAAIGNIPGFLSEVVAEAAGEPEICQLNDGYMQSLFVLAELAGRQSILVAGSTELAAAGWIDLGKTYCRQHSRLHSIELCSSSSSTETTEVVASASQPLLAAASCCAQAAIQLDSGNDTGYILQGVVAMQMQETALAQHAFIMASRRSPDSALPWTNLGFLYLHHNDIELANKAFGRAQMVDPEFVGGWLGQALIAQMLASPESVELFETCLLSVGSMSPPGVIAADYGYAKQVWMRAVERNSGTGASSSSQPDNGAVSTPASKISRKGLSLSDQNQLTLSIYAARRYVEQKGMGEDYQGAGQHLLGLLLEQSGEYESAAEAYHAAYGQLTDNCDWKRQWVALTHLGRSQCSAKQYMAAVETYQQAAELVDSVDDSRQLFFFTLGFSLALFFADQLEDSLGKFEETLERSASVPELRPVVAVALAQVLWALGSDEHRSLAQQHLLEVMGEENNQVFVPGLTALFAMGLLQGDGDLITAIYPELQKARQSLQDQAHDVPKLEMYLAALRGDRSGGKRALTKSLHKDPSDASLWLLLARFEEMSDGGDAMEAAQSAMRLFRQAIRGHFSWSRAPTQSYLNSASLDVAVDACMAEARAAAAAAAGKQQRLSSAKAAARRAVMYQPWRPETWDTAVVAGCALSMSKQSDCFQKKI